MQSFSKHRIIASVLDLLGFIAVLLQVIGCFIPAWMKWDMDVRIPNLYGPDTITSTSTSVGLWTVSACVTEKEYYSYETKCASVSIEDLNKAIDSSSANKTVKADNKEFLRNFLPQKILTAFGVFVAVFGLVFTFAFLRSDPRETTVSQRTSGISCIICWIISATLVFVAVGIQVGRCADFVKELDILTSMSEVKNKLTIEMKSPAAVIVSGIGGALGVLLAVIIALMVLIRRRVDLPKTTFQAMPL